MLLQEVLLVSMTFMVAGTFSSSCVLYVLVISNIFQVFQAELYLANRNGIQCSNKAVFICANNDGPGVQWIITPVVDARRSINFHLLFHSEGEIITRTVESTTARAELISVNSSYHYVTSLTIAATLSATIDCNREKIMYQHENSILPTTLIISININAMSINWTPNGNLYYIKVASSTSNATGIMKVYNSSTSIDLSNTTYNLTISSCKEDSNASNFKIGPCLYHDAHLNNMERTYTLHSDGNWTVFQTCSNKSVPATCHYNGSWTPNITCPHTMHMIITEGYSMKRISTEDSFTSFNSTVNTTSHDVQNANNESQRTYIYWVVPTLIIVLLVITVLAVILLSLIWNKRKKKMSRDYPIHTEVMEATYQQLSNKHQNSKHNFSCNRNLSVKTEMKDLTQHSSLEGKRNSSSANKSSSGYCLRSQPDQTKMNKLEYTEVDTSDYSATTTSELIHIKVDYSEVHIRTCPEDETLNLDSLLIQLNPMSKDFRLFGSVAGISPDTLDKIVASSAAPYDGLVEVCDAWLDKCRKEKTTPTWNAVADILSLIGQDKLSHNLMQVYITGKLPIEVEMNSVASVHIPHAKSSPTHPPPIPPLRNENESEVVLMTVKYAKASKQSSSARPTLDTVIDRPPPIPEKLHALNPVVETEEGSPPPPVPPFNAERESFVPQCKQDKTVLPPMGLQQDKDALVPPLPLKQDKWSSTDKLPTPPVTPPANDQAPPKRPPKLPEKNQLTKPTPAKREKMRDTEVLPSLPPRLPKTTQ